MRIPLIVTDARLASSFGPRRGIRRICVHGAGRPATSWPASIALTPRSLAIALPILASRAGHRRRTLDGSLPGWGVRRRGSRGWETLDVQRRPRLGRGKHVEARLKRFRDAEQSLSAYDFAQTSLPHFNIEKCNRELQSWRMFGQLDAWIDGFYCPLIRNAAPAPKPGAAFALQVGSRSTSSRSSAAP